jgi:hypothetical protein
MRPRWIQTSMVIVALGASAAGAVPAAGQPATKPAPPASAGATPAAPASAQPASPGGVKAAGPAPSGSAAASADPTSTSEIYRQALADYASGDYEKAVKGFEEVWSREKKPKAAGTLGRAEIKVRKFRDAAEHLEFYLRLDTDITADARKEAEAMLAAAKAQITTLRIAATPKGAELTLDGTSVGIAPLDHEIYLDPGKHQVKAWHGQQTETKDIEAPPGGNEIELKLDVSTAPPVVSTTPRDTGFPVRTAVMIGGGGLAVLGAVLLGVGAGKKSEALSKVPKDEAGKSLCAPPGALTGDRGNQDECNLVRSLAGTANALGGTGIGFLVAGALIAGGAAVFPYLPIAQKDSKAAQLVPMVSTDGAGLVWQGSF